MMHRNLSRAGGRRGHRWPLWLLGGLVVVAGSAGLLAALISLLIGPTPLPLAGGMAATVASGWAALCIARRLGGDCERG